MFSDNDDEDDDSFLKNDNALTLDKLSVVDGIRYWALSTNATHKSIDMVLKLFRKVNVKVPATAKTLLQTKRNASSEIMEIGGGQFWYHGIKKCLCNYYRYDKPPSKQLTLTISIDGLPLHNSSAMQFWPILFKIVEDSKAPVMTAAIFCGYKKPESTEQYLRPMVEELNDLISNGLDMHGENVAVKLLAIVADTPARSFVKGVTSHTGYGSCLKCTIEGEYLGHKVTFVGLNAPKRTDQAFRNDAYPGHRKVHTPLLDILFFDIIEDICVADRMHLIDLGATKRLLLGWRDGTLGIKRWTEKQCERISEAFQKVLKPLEVHRKQRHLKYLNHWKASECAFFLHYASFVIIKDHLPVEVYKHFMLLFCSITLFSSTVHKSKWHVAGQLLNKFVENFPSVYGRQYMTSNFHNLQHIYDEMLRFGSLSLISTYPFENHLQFLKRLLRSGWKSLEQAINRLAELDEFKIPKSKDACYPLISEKKKTISVTVREDFVLQNDQRNCWFLTKDNSIVKFHSANHVLETGNNKICIRGPKLNSKELVFDDPIESSEMFIFKSFNNALSETTFETYTDQILCKLVALPTSSVQEIVFVPLIHTLIE
ncbi:uncharacterized protein LOC118516957 isoform X2 [Anopheles stephensi]|nr:uncharacterized protein LOC118513396 isoform X2 [Anopheles stephensi]XP_035917127.1 uncharacterized protein LOC118514373 isoform X2 [Anopheles stephensi]XP_035918678.1 uncharacterized protein LOC118516957 isoform X2 [Anopheles stephensi]